MKTKFSAIFTLLAFVIANAMSFAETPECLSRTYNRVTGIAAGDTARVQTWDFSSASNIEGNLALKRRAVSDSLYADSWLGMNYTFIKKNNVIYCTERSNRLISAKDTLGTIEMIAPMSIGYTAASDYVFFGNYSKELQMIEKGHSHSVFDSVGTLILPNDTIEDVKRVRTDKTYKVLVDDTVSGDIFESIKMSLPEVNETTYRWFTSDNGFPLAVITDYTVTSNGDIFDQGQTAYIVDDPAREKNTPKRSTPPSVVTVEKVEIGKGFLIAHYSVGNAPSDISFVVTDNSGRVCTMKKLKDVPVGEDKVTINTGTIPPGYYLFAASTTGEHESNKRIIIIP